MTTSNTITLRPTLPEDKPFCRHLFALVKTEELQAWQWDETLLAKLMHMQFAAHEQHYRQGQEPISDSILLAEQLAGAVQAIGRMVVLHGASLHLADISLLPEFRNQGFGSRLLGTLQEEASNKRVPLRLSCHPDNPALRLYLRKGFEIIEPGEASLLLEWRPT